MLLRLLPQNQQSTCDRQKIETLRLFTAVMPSMIHCVFHQLNSQRLNLPRMISSAVQTVEVGSAWMGRFKWLQESTRTNLTIIIWQSILPIVRRICNKCKPKDTRVNRLGSTIFQTLSFRSTNDLQGFLPLQLRQRASCVSLVDQLEKMEGACTLWHRLYSEHQCLATSRRPGKPLFFKQWRLLTLYGPYILESVVHNGFAFIKKGWFSTCQVWQ